MKIQPVGISDKFEKKAEAQAMRHKLMYMHDYVEMLDNILKATGEKILEGAGKISHKKALEKATIEYRKYQVENLSPVEKSYFETIKTANLKIENVKKKK